MCRFVKYWLPLVIWLGAMFVGSTNLMSSEHTSRYILPSLVWLNPEISPNTMWTIIIVVRKSAHIIEYGILAFLLWRFLHSFPALRGKTKMCFAAVLLGCAMFAASDEFHQTFVRSRTPSVRDVCLDIAGAVIGLLIAASFTQRDPKKSRRTSGRSWSMPNYDGHRRAGCSCCACLKLNEIITRERGTAVDRQSG